MRLNLLVVVFLSFVLFSSWGCGKTDEAISKPIPGCYDNIQNQGESGVDCGGPCQPCPGKMTAKIDGNLWESTSNVTTQVFNNTIYIIGSNNSTISLRHIGPFTEGTFTQEEGLYTEFNGNQYSTQQCTITFTDWNETDSVVSGTFSFTGQHVGGINPPVQITEGTFENVSF
jgi:hypothetical protein